MICDILSRRHILLHDVLSEDDDFKEYYGENQKTPTNSKERITRCQGCKTSVLILLNMVDGTRWNKLRNEKKKYFFDRLSRKVSFFHLFQIQSGDVEIVSKVLVLFWVFQIIISIQLHLKLILLMLEGSL